MHLISLLLLLLSMFAQTLSGHIVVTEVGSGGYQSVLSPGPDGYYTLVVGRDYEVTLTGPQAPYDELSLDVESGPVFTHWLSDTAGAEWSTICTKTCPTETSLDMTQHTFAGDDQVITLMYRNSVAQAGPIGAISGTVIRQGQTITITTYFRTVHQTFLPMVSHP